MEQSFAGVESLGEPTHGHKSSYSLVPYSGNRDDDDDDDDDVEEVEDDDNDWHPPTPAEHVKVCSADANKVVAMPGIWTYRRTLDAA